MDRRNVNTVKDTGNHDNTCRDLKLEGSSDKNVSRRSITNAFDDEKDDSVRISCKKQCARLKDPAVYNICKQENEKASGSEWQASTTDTTKNGISKEDYDAKISTRLQLYEYQFEPPPSPPELMSLTRHTKDSASQQQNELELPPQITNVTSNLQGRKSNTTSMDMDAAIAVPWQKEEPKTSAASFSQIITSPSRGASRNSEGRTRTIPGTYTDAAIAAPWQKEELNASAATFPRISSPSRGARSYINTSFDWEVLMQLPIDNEQEDTLLATILQATVKAKQEESEEKDRICMLSTRCGRACLFVQKVVAVTNELLGNVASNHYLVPEQNHSQIKAIANDDMIVHVERLLARQDDFRESNKPILVDIGYHYTNQRNIESIKTKSLVTRQELLEQGIHSRSSRVAFFGDGIYTANNPFAFHRDGAEGLLVARIQGATRRAVQAQRLVRRDGSFDTIIGNKAKSYTPASRVDLYDEVVLLNSSQCLPLVQYSSRIIRRNPRVTGADTDSPIRIFHIAMQQIVDEFFNEGKSTSDWTAVKLPPAASVNSDPMVSQSQDPFSGKSWYTPNGQLRSAGVASGQASSPNQGSAPMAATQVSSKRLCSRRSSVSGGTSKIKE